MTSQRDELDEAGGIVYPSDVRSAKVRIDGEMKAVLADAHNCARLPEVVRQDFISFWTSWRYFYCGSQMAEPGVQLLTCSEPDVSIWGLGSQMDDCERFESDLVGWQKKIGGYCQLNSPSVNPPGPGGLPQLPQILSSVVWLAGIGLAFYVLHETGALRLVRAKTA